MIRKMSSKLNRELRKDYFKRLKQLKEGSPGNNLANEIMKYNPKLSTKDAQDIIEYIKKYK